VAGVGADAGSDRGECLGGPIPADGFSDLTREVLTETRLAPEFLEIEVTESVLMSNEKAASETLEELKSMGVNLTIDDFGTGYSSLT